MYAHGAHPVACTVIACLRYALFLVDLLSCILRQRLPNRTSGCLFTYLPTESPARALEGRRAIEIVGSLSLSLSVFTFGNRKLQRDPSLYEVLREAEKQAHDDYNIYENKRNLSHATYTAASRDH